MVKFFAVCRFLKGFGYTSKRDHSNLAVFVAFSLEAIPKGKDLLSNVHKSRLLVNDRSSDREASTFYMYNEKKNVANRWNCIQTHQDPFLLVCNQKQDICITFLGSELAKAFVK